MLLLIIHGKKSKKSQINNKKGLFNDFNKYFTQHLISQKQHNQLLCNNGISIIS